MKLGNINIGVDYPPLIIAEISANHNNDFERVTKMIDAASSAGVKCLKIQTWFPGSMTLNIKEWPFLITDEKSLWKGYTLHDLYERAHMPWDWYKPIFQQCKDLGIQVISTPFDIQSVDFLEMMNVPFYKIASFENVDLQLIAKVAQTQKPIIISCGLANIIQISEAVECARDNGAKDIVLLKCTSQYPARPENINLKTLPHMRELFNCEVGLSDHTQGVGVAIGSVAFGATVIEKHFNLSEGDESLDEAFSIDSQKIKMLIDECFNAWAAQGKVFYGITDDEVESLQYRRSLYVIKDIKAGEVFSEENIRAIRPGYGLAPKHYMQLLGRKATQNLHMGTPLSWKYVG